MVAQWLGAHAGEVRIVEVESPQGWALPADRVPELAELVELADPCGSDGVRDPGARVGSAA
jgi:hypothetical protein